MESGSRFGDTGRRRGNRQDPEFNVYQTILKRFWKQLSYPEVANFSFLLQSLKTKIQSIKEK